MNDERQNDRGSGLRRLFVVSTLFCGLGGQPKPVFCRLGSRIHEHYGFHPEVLPMAILDVDPAAAEVTVGDMTYSTDPYLTVLSKRRLLDVAKRLRAKGPRAEAIRNTFGGYVELSGVRGIEAPGWNHVVQSGNLGFRLLWQDQVLPVLNTKLQHLHPSPNALERLARQGLEVSSRSVIWVVAGGATTTGPTGLIPTLCELKRLKPPQTNLFAIVFCPAAFRDKSLQHRVKGMAIYRSTLEQLTRIAAEQSFDQPYGMDGYRIRLDEEPFDQLFLVDGTLGGDLRRLEADELSDLVARFLFECAAGPAGVRLLGILGNLNNRVEGTTK